MLSKGLLNAIPLFYDSIISWNFQVYIPNNFIHKSDSIEPLEIASLQTTLCNMFTIMPASF